MMNLQITYEEFCKQYYKFARVVANDAITDHVLSHGKIDARLDIDLIKDLAICYALEKVYATYDVDYENHPTVNAYLRKVTYRAVLTQMEKEGVAVKGGKGQSIDFFIKGGKEYRVGDYIKYENRYERKEEALAKLMEYVRKLMPIDQMIIGFWMVEKRTYVEKVLEELGMEDNKRNRNIIYIRQCKALGLLRQMMGGVKPDYRDIYIHVPGVSRDEKEAAAALDSNAVRRRRRTATAYITRNVDLKQAAENIYKELAG